MADLGQENDLINYAIQRLIHFGDLPSNIVSKEKIAEIAQLIRDSKISDENLLKAVTALVYTASQLLDQKDTARSIQAKTIVSVTVNGISGLAITDELRDKIALELDNNPQFNDILTKPIDDLTDEDFHLFETTILARVVEEQTDENTLLGLFDKALEIDYEEEEPTFDIGNANFLKAKEAYIIDVVTYMREVRGENEDNFLRAAPSEEEKAEMASKAALSLFSDE